MPDSNATVRCRLQIDAVIARPVANDRAELRHPVHHLPAQRRRAGGDYRADAREFILREHLMRRLATGVEEVEALADALHQRFGKTRVNQDLFRHCCFP
jgi:hypothetical protein